MHKLVEQGEIERRHALRGFNVSIWLQAYAINESTGKPDESNPYIAVDIFSELGRRAGFNWIDSFGVIASPTENETWTNVLNNTVNEYDIAVDYWARTLERVSSGFLYPEPWYDASLIMFQDAQAMRVQMNFFAFVQPFSGSVWYLIAFTIIFTATVFYLIHFLNNRLETHGMNIHFGNTLFQTFSASTGQNELQSDYMANKIVIASMIFWSLLIVTCYVASLTSFLVNRNYVKIENFEELMNKEYQE